MVVILAWRLLTQRFRVLRGDLQIPRLGQGVVVGWSGMRGLITLATAFALPASFPQKNLVTLVAFAVVLVTLVLQGCTLGPLIRLLRLDEVEDPEADLRQARLELSAVGLREIERRDDRDDLNLRALYELKRDAGLDGAADRLTGYRGLGRAVVAVQRERLLRLREEEAVDMDGYYRLQEEIDWRELTLLPDDERRIDET